ELSLTQVLDSARAGRAFFDDVIRHNLDLGRPDRVGLIFDRRIYRGKKNVTPGGFRTRAITEGGTPSLHIDYKHSKIKQYHNSASRCAPRPRSTTRRIHQRRATNPLRRGPRPARPRPRANELPPTPAAPAWTHPTTTRPQPVPPHPYRP